MPRADRLSAFFRQPMSRFRHISDAIFEYAAIFVFATPSCHYLGHRRHFARRFLTLRHYFLSPFFIDSHRFDISSSIIFALLRLLPPFYAAFRAYSPLPIAIAAILLSPRLRRA
jgi:hypothetical protein